MENSDLEIISHLKPSKIVKIMRDPEASAKAVHLVYTSDAETAGIIRKKTEKNILTIKTAKKSRIRTRSQESTNWLFLRPGKMSGSVLWITDIFRQQDLM
ncbi:hypothetical protein [Chryseobacterium wanjuense]